MRVSWYTGSMRNLVYASLFYCATCFAAGAGTYALIHLTGSAEFRDSTGAVVENVTIPAQNLFYLCLFFGAMTTLFCLGGLLGVWILAARVRRTARQHAGGGILLAVIGCGIFLFGTSLGENHLALRAFEVAAVTIVSALLVRMYVATSPRLTTRSG